MGCHQTPIKRICLLLLVFIALSGSTNSDKTDLDQEREHPQNDLDPVKISAEEAQRLYSIYGGIGPVINSSLFKDKSRVSRSIASQRHEPKDNFSLKASQPIPEQIHLSYGNNPTQMVVIWSTPVSAPSKVMYGMDSAALTQVVTTKDVMFTKGNPDGLQYLHKAVMEDLKPGKQYYYQVHSGDQHSDIYAFKAMNDSVNWSFKLHVFGDMGHYGGAPALRILNDSAAHGLVDAIIHVGDFAYDLNTDGGKVGDDFMNRLQPIATTLPYMTCPGNHEIPHNFSHYLNRFSMPGQVWPTDVNKMWFSFNMGNVHFVSYSTEVYFTNGPIDAQYKWLLNDLQQANKAENRAKRPWVIAYGHRPMYCSNVDVDGCTVEGPRLRKGFEQLFYSQGVDIIFEGHEHSYERLWPVYNGTVHEKSYVNPTTPIHLISASAGCNDLDGLCLDPILGPRGDWSAFRAWRPGLHGVGKLHVVNGTHLHWQQIIAKDESIMDDIWIEQNHHGPFKAASPFVKH